MNKKIVKGKSLLTNSEMLYLGLLKKPSHPCHSPNGKYITKKTREIIEDGLNIKSIEDLNLELDGQETE